MNLTTMASIILSRAMLAARAGQQFGGARDLYAILGYKYAILGYKKDLAFADHYARFRRQNIASRAGLSQAEARGALGAAIFEFLDSGYSQSYFHSKKEDAPPN